MKKLSLLFTLLIIALLPNIVKADVIQSVTLPNNGKEIDLFNNSKAYCLDGEFCSLNESLNELLNYYNNNYKNQYPYFAIELNKFPNNDYFSFVLYFKTDKSLTFSSVETDNNVYHWITNFEGSISFNNGVFYDTLSSSTFGIFGGFEADNLKIEIYSLWDSNLDLIAQQNYEIQNFYSNSSLYIEKNKKFPLLKDLINYSSWSEYFSNTNNLTTVNLDDYYYVLLSLKDYSKKKAFSSNLQVKGQIGITPIYDYGQTSKDDVTNFKVTDRCNVSYSDFTNYPFYINENDLKNNSIYAFKGCSSGSSFKYDSSIFDITYITDTNKDDPVVTINGKEYHTIPFDQLPSTANKNEEENYIPGSSEESGNSNSFTGIIGSILSNTSDFIYSITAFMSLISKFFSSLPLEIRAVILTSFATMCTLGVIKFLKA